MTELAPPPEPRSTRLAGTLALAGLLAGVALAGAYTVTKPRIERNRAEALRRAVFEVVPGAARMRELEGECAGVFAAYDEGGAFLGFAIQGAAPGYQDTIALIYGYDPARRRVVGMRVLESRETPGLGDKIFKDAAFVAEFDDLAVEPEIVAVKAGKATGAAHEVDAITGATISSNAVVRIINEANAEWLERLPAPADVPPAPPPEEAPR